MDIFLIVWHIVIFMVIVGVLHHLPSSFFSRERYLYTAPLLPFIINIGGFLISEMLSLYPAIKLVMILNYTIVPAFLVWSFVNFAQKKPWKGYLYYGLLLAVSMLIYREVFLFISEGLAPF